MTWELWDEDSGNRLGDFDNRTEAVEVAADFIAATSDPKGFVLLTLDNDDQVVGAIAGVELANEADRLKRAVYA
jgi:ABC-type sugar transport system substrate-binding protein